MKNKIIELVLSPQEAFDPAIFQQTVFEKLHLNESEAFSLTKRSIDARSRNVRVRVVGEVVSKERMGDSIT